MRTIKFHEAIREATDQAMEKDPSVYIMGLGVPDPKGIFGTTSGLQAKYGSHRVMDMPTSENAMTGVAIGSAINGLRPIVTHQRVDFFLLALDQLINNASKWHFMFGGKHSVPLVIRLIIGRGWGQGPQHSQTLQSLFAHIPGLKVVMPSSPYDAKGLLIASIEDNNPVIYLEHRWLHGVHGHVPSEMYKSPLGKAKFLQHGEDLTLVSCSIGTLEAFKAIDLIKNENIKIDFIDLCSIRPLDTDAILSSVKKTGRLLVVDPDWKTVGLSAEILAMVSESCFEYLKAPPVRICYPDSPCPTSWPLANQYYPQPKDIAASILKMLAKPYDSFTKLAHILENRMGQPLDIPDPSFTGPF